ncbi:hypothetical protein KGM_212806 [Danaus plexippus plexippus]|uniref:Uncharacterized protein n=1 Tax=Danaus plexippus plexippus TaxID=278856 RepID=A0A212F6E6_DANPL|nr:hypothetical protein KGM_212806 [Danaus plexippus plexippus]
MSLLDPACRLRATGGLLRKLLYRPKDIGSVWKVQGEGLTGFDTPTNGANWLSACLVTADGGDAIGGEDKGTAEASGAGRGGSGLRPLTWRDASTPPCSLAAPENTQNERSRRRITAVAATKETTKTAAERDTARESMPSAARKDRRRTGTEIYDVYYVRER